MTSRQTGGTVFPTEVFDERRELVERMANVPSDYLANNLVSLMRLIGEFQASLVLELQVIQGVKNLDVSDSATVRDYVKQFSDYVARRAFDLECTSCGQIGRIYDKQVR